MSVDLARAALAAWGGCRGAPRLVAERENAVYEVRLADGRRAALRLHRAGYRSAEAIAAELGWTAQLAAAGLPCPAPVPCATGRMLAGAPDGRLASVVGWVPARPLEAARLAGPDGAEVMRRLGDTLARVHAATDRLCLPVEALPRWDAEALLGAAPAWGRFWQNPALAPDESDLLQEVRDAARARLAALEAPDIGLIHADLLPDNVLDDGARLWLIDFDDCGVGHRGYDLGTALIAHAGSPAYGDLAAALVTGYAARRGVSAARLAAALPLFVLLRGLASCGWIAGRAGPGDPRARAYAERAVRLAERFLARAGA